MRSKSSGHVVLAAQLGLGQGSAQVWLANRFEILGLMPMGTAEAAGILHLALNCFVS